MQVDYSQAASFGAVQGESAFTCILSGINKQQYTHLPDFCASQLTIQTMMHVFRRECMMDVGKSPSHWEVHDQKLLRSL